MAKQYGSRSATFTLTGSVSQLIGGNGGRVTVVLSITGPVNSLFLISTDQAGNEQILQIFAPGVVVMPYRDYGPLIKNPLYGTCSSVGNSITVTEVYEIG